MFEKLKSAFSSAAQTLTERSLSEKELAELMAKLELDLIENDVAFDVVKGITDRLKVELQEEKIRRRSDMAHLVKTRLKGSIQAAFSNVETIDIFERIEATRRESDRRPFVVLFLGVNGSGKTTTVAKFAKLLANKGFSIVISAGDTHRAGAIEQLSEHSGRLGIKLVSQRYGADPAAVARDGVNYARTHKIDVVIIDTAGRMQTSTNLMDEMAKIVRVVKPDLKIFVVDALTGNDAISQATKFLEFTGFDGVVLTKVDADAKGGAALSIVSETKKPILYLGIGQEYDDLVPFIPETFVSNLFENSS
ncbi:MAG: signal recognition particle-docking protein FtsY [Thaumarchaeota archaeon]|nr:signal recognition particle-docking protein FtsY [Nitrososphaerota archaeon]